MLGTVADVPEPVEAPSRRRLLVAGTHLLGAGILAGCGLGAPRDRTTDRPALLTARPTSSPSGPVPEEGTGPLRVADRRDALLHVPPGLTPGRPAPLVVTLHGAGGTAELGLGLLRPLADERGLLLLAPASRGRTWDAVGGGYGRDVDLLDRALAEVFSTVPVDPDRIAVAGFSDGASYALGIGLANGRLFGRIIAFSPGFVPPAPHVGRPAVFVSHGVADLVLPIRRTSRKIVPRLRDRGYDVRYREYAGPHAVRTEVAREAVDWLGWS